MIFLRMKRAFEVKWKNFFFVSLVLSFRLKKQTNKTVADTIFKSISSYIKFLSHWTWSIRTRTRYPCPGLLDFPRNLFFQKKSEILAKHGQLTIDAIALIFSPELDSTDCFMGFGEIRFLKWHDVNNSNFWFLVILNRFSQGLYLFKQIFFS